MLIKIIKGFMASMKNYTKFYGKICVFAFAAVFAQVCHAAGSTGYTQQKGGIKMARLSDNKRAFSTDGWRAIDSELAYDGNDLGCVFNNNQATIKVWAPLAQKADFILYDKNNQYKQILKTPMQQTKNGIWQIVLENCDSNDPAGYYGYFYQFEITNPDREPKKILDPYARSMAAVKVVLGQSDDECPDYVGKAAIINPEITGETVIKANIKNYEKREDAIIYEVHIRDFTSDPSIEPELAHRWGSYKAFISKLPYIKALGVTHIQLLPVMAWYWGDETLMGTRELAYKAKGNNYNWGYDPQNYFSPDGAYSENPNDPALRIKELKALINAVHKAGMGVILDAVYTHMARADFLDDIVPNYYFFRDKTGKFLGDFGNNLATNRKMAEKLLVDSVKYWFKEYKIDGIRFDMMGDATYTAIQKAYNEAASINPKALFIGEGWQTFKGAIEDEALKGMGADQKWVHNTLDVGVFSDEMRNELKSGFGSEGEPRFLSGGPRDIKTIFANIKAEPTNFKTSSPASVVQYIEAHDNLPVYDVLAYALKKDPEIAKNNEELLKRAKLGLAIILTSQGTAFIHAGQEYGRTKQWFGKNKPEQKYTKMLDENKKPFKHPYFIYDSYDSSDAINRFDWAKATDKGKYPLNVETVEYAKGLIALRRSTDAFRLTSIALANKNVKLIKTPEVKEKDLAIAYSCTSTDNSKYYVFINADMKKRVFTSDLINKELLVLADSTTAGVEPITQPTGCVLDNGALYLEPLSACVCKVP